MTVLFEDTGHSSDARRLVQSFKVGKLEGGDVHSATKLMETAEGHAEVAKVAAEAKKFDKLSAAVATGVFTLTVLLLLLS